MTTTPPTLAQLMRWDWVADNVDDIAAATAEHLQLTVLSVLLGLVVAIPLALIIRRFRFLEGPISGTAGVLYTIPALAAFALLVPVLGLTSIWTPLLPLASYSLLILLRNTLTGLDGVPDELREAADGLGYRPLRRFVEVEVPLALPAIIAGVRVAVVTNVGLVTVTALLGRGGLGAFILDGIRRSIPFPTSIIVGTVGSIVLAVVLDLSLLGVERAVAPWQRRPR